MDYKTNENENETFEDFGQAWAVVGALISTGYLEFDMQQDDAAFHLRGLLRTVARVLEVTE